MWFGDRFPGRSPESNSSMKTDAGCTRSRSFLGRASSRRFVSTPGPGPSWEAKMRILMIEDDDRIARDVSAALAASGYIVDRATDGEEAWFKGDTEDYAAVVLDLGLPRLDGLSVLKRWRANGRAMPVLILTARDTWLER